MSLRSLTVPVNPLPGDGSRATKVALAFGLMSLRSLTVPVHPLRL